MRVWATLLLCALIALAAGVASAEDDFYEILGLGDQRDDASERDIKAAWRKLSKQHHPDLVGEGSRAHYQRIQRAYEVLGDRRRRKVYDIRGEEGLKQLEQPHANQQMDPFAQLFGFGGGGGGGGANANKGPNVAMLMLVPLEDIYNGATHEVRLSKTKLCKACRGTGAASKGDFVTCPACGGSGTEVQRVQIMPGFVQQVQAQCSQCGGKGKRVGRKCPTCGGERVTRTTMTLSVDIERGLPEGHDVVYEMEADQQPDQIPGDVIFTVTSAPHPVFTRRGDDLNATVTLSLSEALLGFEKNLPHLDGHAIELSEEGVTQHNHLSVVRGEGLPRHDVPSERGELYVTYKVELPSVLTAQQREKIGALFPV